MEVLAPRERGQDVSKWASEIQEHPPPKSCGPDLEGNLV